MAIVITISFSSLSDFFLSLSLNFCEEPKLIPLIAIILSVAAIALSIAALVKQPAVEEKPARDVQYVMYLGTNDKDTYEPIFSHEEAKEHLDAVLTKHFSGFTIQEANGGWTNDDGTVSHEYTLVIYLSDTTLDKVHAASDDLIREFNQSSVLIQANETVTEFYEGKK